MTDVDDRRWWQSAVGYEVYLRSFADSDGDGIGDLNGVEAKLDHLVELGIDLLWLTPFYPSPMADYGYDVADYTGVHPLFGDLDGFDRLLSEAHQRNIRVVIDIVPNHSSDKHPWFVEALEGRDNPFRDHYLWADPAADGGPPNNWIGYFGGPAWTFEPVSGQYYLHLFLPQQPDLNWSNPAVLDAFDDILRFWLDRGVDGFRIDVAQALTKDQSFRSNPELAPWDPDAARWEQWDAFEHLHDVLQPEGLDIYRRWNELVAPYDAFLLGETYELDAKRWADLLPGDGLHAGFWFKTMHVDWNPSEIREALGSALDAANDPTMIGWVAASHDEPRPPTRFGGGDLGRSRSLAFSTLLFGLPGLPMLYQGEELGLVDGEVPNELRADPVGSDVSRSRDGCRTPMPWSAGDNFGFSAADTTWLPIGGRTEVDTAEWQAANPGSWFHRYAALIAARRANPELLKAEVEWLDVADDLVAYCRGSIVVAANVGQQPAALDVGGTLLFATTDRLGDAGSPLERSMGDGSGMWLEPGEAVMIGP